MRDKEAEGTGGLDVVAHPQASGVLARLRGNARLCRPGEAAFFGALEVVDVELATGAVTVQAALSGYDTPPEGVYAVLWADRTPVGELAIAGDPSRILPGLPDLAARHVGEHGLAPASDADSMPSDASPSERLLTVAVCTRDRPEFLHDCLTSIAALERPVAEVLVIDNASRDGRTRDVARAFPFVRYVWEPREGLDWARNRALLEARTPVVAFTDDDVLVHRGWVEGIARAFRARPDAAAVTGLVVPAELATAAQVQFEGRTGFGRGYQRRSFSVSASETAGGSATDVAVGAAGSGANMAFRREVALGLGGFDVALDVGTPSGGGGDLEMFFRLVSSGHLLVYEPSAVVRHRHRRTMAELARQRRGDGSGNYSILLGAGRLYDERVRRQFRGLALWWLAERYGRRIVASLLWPALWPPSLVYADAKGMLDATFGRYYERGVSQAAAQSIRHPDQPAIPFLRGLPTQGRGASGEASHVS